MEFLITLSSSHTTRLLHNHVVLRVDVSATSRDNEVDGQSSDQPRSDGEEDVKNNGINT
jgi:hypothetical protein